MTIAKNDDPRIVLRNSSELSDDELTQMKEAIFREFKVPFRIQDNPQDTLYFFLKQQNAILAMGALGEVTPVIFNGDEFTFLGVLNVVANEKGKGYGKQVVTAMRESITTQDRTGLGFCFPSNKGFYEKCGFKIEANSTQRFVYRKGIERIINQDGQIIFYQDCSDDFMKKVLANPGKVVTIPTQGLW